MPRKSVRTATSASMLPTAQEHTPKPWHHCPWCARQGAWLRFMYRMQTSQATSQWPEPHLGLRPWMPPPQPPPNPKRLLARQQSAPGGRAMDRQSLQAAHYGRSSEGNLNRAAE